VFRLISRIEASLPGCRRAGRYRRRLVGRVAAYAPRCAAVSVLTEPSRFDGSLEHLRQATAVLAPLGVPAMRKDFLVIPYQVLEARAAGAGGVLVILRMLPRERIAELLDAAADHRLFVLLEAFDAADLELARELLAPRRSEESILIGINSRDLQTLKVVQKDLPLLAPLLPAGGPASPKAASRRRSMHARCGSWVSPGADRHRLDEPR